MMTVEQWHEYGGKYRRHGFEMKPKGINANPKQESASITPQEGAKIITLLFLIGVLCVSIIISTAYVASVRYEINSINRQSVTLQGEIENLNVQIKNATNIKTIEEKAINDLGMIYPSASQFVFLQNDAGPLKDFATLLKVQAYN